MNDAAQARANLVTQSNIDKVRAALAAETNLDRRAGLEKLLTEQLNLLTPPVL